MSPTRRADSEDRLGYFLRLTLYATCIVLPFMALLLGRMEGEQTVAAVLTLMGALGPMVALSRVRTEAKVEDRAFTDGLVTGLEADEGPHGRHRLEDREDEDL